MSREAGLVVAMLMVFALIGLFVERRRLTVKELALVAALSALAALGRVPFAALPGIQPTTFIVIVSGAVFGPSLGFLVGALGALTSNFFLGHGPWTVFQVVAWGGCGASAVLLLANSSNNRRAAFVLFGVAWGFLFGWIMNLWHWLMFVHPLSFKSWLALCATSFYFDAMHACTNGFLCWLAGPDVLRALRRFKQKIEFSFEDESNECVPQLAEEQKS